MRKGKKKQREIYEKTYPQMLKIFIYYVIIL